MDAVSDAAAEPRKTKRRGRHPEKALSAAFPCICRWPVSEVNTTDVLECAIAMDVATLIPNRSVQHQHVSCTPGRID